LPKELHPPLALKLRWIAGVEAVEKKYRHRVEAAKELAAHFRKNNIRMMLFKGIALARLYPVPASREFGDIDIFLCGKAEEGDMLLEHITGTKWSSSVKHENFSYRGIVIENHRTFLNRSNHKFFHRYEFLENQLLTLLAEAGITTETDFDASLSPDETLLFPPPDFDALYIILHLLAHLPRNIVLRNLCDLTVLFTACYGKIDFPRYRNALANAGLLKLADAFISLSVKYLGLNPACAPPYESDLLLENRLWNDLLNPEVCPLPKKHTLFNIIIYKFRLLRLHQWKYELVFPGQFWKKIFHLPFFYLRHPGKIRKLRI